MLLATYLAKVYKRLISNVVLTVLLIIVVTTITFGYISSEHTFYSWDYVTYQYKTASKAIEFLNSPHLAIAETWISTSANYSDVPTLLLVPFLLAFGDSRLVYILSIALVYLLPFALVLGAIAVRLIPGYPWLVYWSTAILTLLTPLAWVPTLRGYPDVGAALLIAIAILIYLQDCQLKRRSQIVLLGFLIVTAALFRRHFVYNGIAFLAAIALQALTDYTIQRQRSPDAWRNLVKSSIDLCWLIAIILITLATLGLPFLAKILITNFSQLYTSFEVSSTQSIQYYGIAYGWITWLLAGLGYAAGMKTRVLSLPAARFMTLFGSFSLLQWILKVKLLGEHYTLHFTTAIILGLAAFGWTTWLTLKGRTRILVLGISTLYLVFNAAIGLTNADLNNTLLRLTKSTATFSVINKTSELFSRNHSPLRHPDYDQIAQLVTYLRSLPSKGQNSIYLAAATRLNESLVKNAEKTLYEQTQLNLLPTPRFDSRDFYPLEPLLQAQYVVIASPYQVKNAQEQKVLTVVVDAFKQQWEIAQDFNRLPVEFTLTDNVVINIYQRIRPTSLATAVRTFDAMHSYIGRHPGSQSEWISITEMPGHNIEYEKINRKNHILQTHQPKIQATSFLHIASELPQQIRLTGKLTYLDRQCANVTLRLNAVNKQGEVINKTNLLHRPTDASDFRLSFHKQNATYLVFNLAVHNRSNASDRCSVKIEELMLKT